MSAGTFDAVGVSEAVVINERGNLSLAFDGTGSVTLQRFMNSDWRDVPDGTWTAGTEDIVYSGAQQTKYRLNCTASGGDIHWVLG